MQLINKSRILRTFDKDTENFIKAAGLDSDANLNVDGLYTAEQARMAVSMLFNGLKSIKDVGQGTSVWDRITVGQYFITGIKETHALNIKNPTINLSDGYLTFNNSVVHNQYGIINAGANSAVINIPYNQCGGSQGSSHVLIFSKSNRKVTNQGDFYAMENEMSGTNLVTIESNHSGTCYTRMYHSISNRASGVYKNTLNLICLSAVNSINYVAINGDLVAQSGVSGNFANINGLPRFGYWDNAGPSDKTVSFQSVGYGITLNEYKQINHLLLFIENGLNRLVYN